MGEIVSSKTTTFTDYSGLTKVFQGRDIEAYQTGKKETTVRLSDWEKIPANIKGGIDTLASKGNEKISTEKVNTSVTIQRDPKTHEVKAIDISEGEHYLFMLVGLKKSGCCGPMPASVESYKAAVDQNYNGIQDENEPEVQVLLIHKGLYSTADMDPTLIFKPMDTIRIISEKDNLNIAKK